MADVRHFENSYNHFI